MRLDAATSRELADLSEEVQIASERLAREVEIRRLSLESEYGPPPWDERFQIIESIQDAQAKVTGALVAQLQGIVSHCAAMQEALVESRKVGGDGHV